MRKNSCFLFKKRVSYSYQVYEKQKKGRQTFSSIRTAAPTVVLFLSLIVKCIVPYLAVVFNKTRCISIMPFQKHPYVIPDFKSVNIISQDFFVSQKKFQTTGRKSLISIHYHTVVASACRPQKVYRFLQGRHEMV